MKDNPKKKVIELKTFAKYLKDNNLSFYHVSKVTDIPEGTLFAYRTGRVSIPEIKCRIISDALKEDVLTLFPDLKETDPEIEAMDFELKKNFVEQLPIKNGSKDQNIQKKNSKEGNEKMKIEIQDMMPGSQMLLPEDGKTIKVRAVRNHEHVDFEGYQFSSDENVIIKTGIKTKRFDIDRMLFRLDKFFVENYELCSPSTVYDYNGELCVIIQSTGMPFQVGNGKEIGELVFL